MKSKGYRPTDGGMMRMRPAAKQVMVSMKMSKGHAEGEEKGEMRKMAKGGKGGKAC